MLDGWLLGLVEVARKWRRRSKKNATYYNLMQRPHPVRRTTREAQGDHPSMSFPALQTTQPRPRESKHGAGRRFNIFADATRASSRVLFLFYTTLGFCSDRLRTNCPSDDRARTTRRIQSDAGELVPALMERSHQFIELRVHRASISGCIQNIREERAQENYTAKRADVNVIRT